MGANADINNNGSSTLNPKNVTLADQAETGEFIRGLQQEKQKSGVFDSASDTVSQSLTPVFQNLLHSLPDTVQEPGNRVINTQQLILDSTVKQIGIFQQKFGRDVPDAVLDSAIRSALPLINPNYARALGLDTHLKSVGVYDEVSNVSGGALQVRQALTAILLAFNEQIPFSGVCPVGINNGGLEGRIIQVSHRADSNVGGYNYGDSLDGLNSGKPYLQGKRFADATQGDNGQYTALITLHENDTQGCPIRSNTATAYINGLPAVIVQPSGTNSNTFTGSATFSFPGDATSYHVSILCQNTDTGKIDVTVNPPLPAGTRIRVSADVNYEHATMKDKRPKVVTHAEYKHFGVHYFSGYYNVTSEARAQWQSEVNIDPSTQATIALRTQSYNERHMVAIDCMYEVAQSYQHQFSLDWLNRLSQRNIASIVQDLSYSLSQVDTEMVARTQLSSLGVIYVGMAAVKYFEAMDPSIFTKSGERKRPGIYRIGKWAGLYDVFYTPSPKLNRPVRDSFQMLAIGCSDQVAGNPYLTGQAVAPIITPFSINSAGEQGAYYFGAITDTMNPLANMASAAALITVTDIE